MTFSEFLNVLEQCDIRLSVRGDRIRIDAPAGVLLPDMLSVLTANKAGLLVMLKTQAIESQLRWSGAAMRRELARLHAHRNHLNALLDKRYEFLYDLAQRVGQDSPEFERYFAEWLKIKDEYEGVCDEIVVLEARRELAEWLKTLPPPRGRRAGDTKEVAP